MRTGPGTVAALAAAGKSAATVGGVIHLRRLPDRSPASAQIVAHELVHVARPSSKPRFFADERHSAEEVLAERTGGLARALMSSRPATPTVRTQTMAVGALGGAVKALSRDVALPSPPVVQRKAGGSSLVERTADMFRRPRAASTPAVPALAAGAAADPEFPRPGDAPIVRRFSTGQPAAATTAAAATDATEAVMTGGINAATFDALVEALEQRVIDELERRGLRHHPGVF